MKLLTIHEAAAQARCSIKTVRRAIDTKDLKAFKPAGRLLLTETDVRAWIERSAVVPLMDARLRVAR